MSRRIVGHREAARILGLSAGTLYNYRSQGIGPRARTERDTSQKGPARVLYDVADLEAWKAAATCSHCGQYIPMRERDSEAT